MVNRWFWLVLLLVSIEGVSANSLLIPDPGVADRPLDEGTLNDGRRD
jgi:hypothetical protein